MTVAWVQTQVDTGVTNPGAATTLTWSLLHTFTSGNALTGQIYYEPNGTGALVTGIADNVGNTYPVLGDSASAATANRIALFGKANVSGAPTTISATFSASPNGAFDYMWADESSGAGAVDASAIFNNTSATSTPTSGNLSPTTAADLLLAYYSPETGSVPTAGAGFTLRLVDSTIGLYSESKLLSSSTPVPGTFGQTTAGTGVVGAIALSPSASCVPRSRLLGVGCGIWAAQKIEENPIITRRRLILPPAIPISRDSEKKGKLYNQQGTPL